MRETSSDGNLSISRVCLYWDCTVGEKPIFCRFCENFNVRVVKLNGVVLSKKEMEAPNLMAGSTLSSKLKQAIWADIKQMIGCSQLGNEWPIRSGDTDPSDALMCSEASWNANLLGGPARGSAQCGTSASNSDAQLFEAPAPTSNQGQVRQEIQAN